ncbi:MAG: 3-deoxy-D-manno-octulosonic acid transferase [Deltaproteobacteria bacterium]|nr:3-deoxy-D-manno-octulosonic acid transferase [Deltaproteobacteria bacterium]
MHFLYNLAIVVVFALALPVLLLHRKTRAGTARRFGIYPRDAFVSTGRPRIWLHGASAGDLLALSPMIRELKAQLPGCTVILSTLTNSGYLMGKERIRGADAITFVPWDLPGATRRAVRAIAPDLLVLEYAEIWPNLIRAAKKGGARVAVTNGRFSPSRLGSYRLLFSLIGNPLQDVDLFLMREDEEAERALRLGAPLDRVWVTGNTKFDALVPAGPTPPGGDELARAFGFPPEAPVFICGSTHEGEEQVLIEVFKRLLAEHPELRLVVAPRYIERAAKVKAMAQDAGLSARLRSEKGTPGTPPRVAVLDTIGELATAYRLATLVFVGGSFTTRGGQNILEPAAQGKPVLFGPHMDNFHDSVQVLVGRGGIQVKDADHLYRVAHELLARPEKMREVGALARSAVSQIRGASARNVGLMARLLERRPAGGLSEGSAGGP